MKSNAPSLPPENAPPGVIPATERKRLRQVEPRRFRRNLMILGVLLSLAGYGVLVTTGVAKIAMQVVLGVLFAHAVELVHQCLHGTATGNRRVDYALGMILGLPALVSFWRYLYSHLYHHANNGTDDDRESFDYAYDLLQSPSRATRILGFVWHLKQVAHYLTASKYMGKALTGRLQHDLRTHTPKMPVRIALLIQRDYRIMAAGLILGITLSIILQSRVIIDLWLIPVLLGYGPAHALIELPEHFLCDHPTENVFASTRSVKAGWFGQWLTNYNGNHVGHHFDPLVPLHNAPALEYLLLQNGGFKYREETYPGFYRRVARSYGPGSGINRHTGRVGCG